MADTPSYQGTERHVTVPGTETPEMTVTAPRVDIREPVDIQAGGETTVPSISTEERRITLGGTRCGVPEQDTTVDLFGADESETIADRRLRRGAVARHRPGGADDTTGQTSSAAGPWGIDGHLTPMPSRGGSVGTDATPSTTGAIARSGPSAEVDRGGSPTWRRGLLAASTGSNGSGGPVAGPSSGTSSSDRSMVAWGAGITMLTLAGAGYLLAQRRAPLTVS